jgi:hypothetical protein
LIFDRATPSRVKPTSWLPGPSVLSAYGLLLLGLLSLLGVALPGGSVLRAVTPADLLTGTGVLDIPSLAVGGGLFFVGVAAVSLGLALLFARVTLRSRARRR